MTRAPLRIGIVTFVALLVPISAMVAAGTVTPIELMRVGADGPSADLVAEVIGPEVLPADEVGFDGQQSWAIAETFPDLDAAAPHLDDPTYRLGRILPSALASLAPSGQGTAFALVLLTIFGCALSVGSTGDLCQRHGRDPRLGYLALLPLAYSIGFSTSEPLAFGLASFGLCFAARADHAPAAALIALGCLARESALVFAGAAVLGTGLVRLRERRLPPVSLAWYGVPAAVIGGWTWWVRARFEVGSAEPRITPLGILDASLTGLALGLAIIALGFAGAWLWRDAPVVWPVPLAFAVGCLLYYDLLFRLPTVPRVSAPAITFGLAGLVHLALTRDRAGPRAQPEARTTGSGR